MAVHEPVPRPAAPGSTRIGWIGTGVMGSPMCGHLLERGYSVTVSNRTRERAQPLEARGAQWAESPAAVAAASDVVFTMVGFPEDVRAVIVGPRGVVDGARAGTTVVDMTTSEPTLAREIADAAATRGVDALDAPVSGGDVGAHNGTLSIMVGGSREAFETVLPCFEAMGSTIVHQGDSGAGQHTKMVNQVLVAGNMIGVCEGMLYAYRAGLDIERVLRSVSRGAAGSWSLTNLAPRIVANDMAPGFFVDHFVKDMGIALAEADRMRVVLPGLALVRQLYVALQGRGHGRDGTQSLIRALAGLSGIEWTARSDV